MSNDTEGREPWRLTPAEEAWASRVLPSLLRQRAAIQQAGRCPRFVLVDFDEVPSSSIRLDGAMIIGLPVLDSPGIAEPTVAIEERLPGAE